MIKKKIIQKNDIKEKEDNNNKVETNDIEDEEIKEKYTPKISGLFFEIAQ